MRVYFFELQSMYSGASGAIFGVESEYVSSFVCVSSGVIMLLDLGGL